MYSMPEEIVIIGAGGVGREIAATLKHKAMRHFVLKGFIDDGAQPGSMIAKVPVLGNMEWLLASRQYRHVVIAVGNPAVRSKILERLDNKDFVFPVIIHPGAGIHDPETVSVGKGCYIADGTVITTDVTIEDYCFINTACSLQHDTYLETNTVIMPGVRITGGARIGRNSYIGANCAITTKCTIAENSHITASIR